jgi:uncharacterized small protein (DUF1192 family)
MDWGNAIITVIVALIAASPGIVAYFRTQKKDEAEAAGILIDKSLLISEGWEKRIGALEKEICKLKKRERIYILNQKELLRVITELKDVMRENGIDYDIEPELVDIESVNE